MNITDDFFIQKHLINWLDVNFVSVDAKAKAYGEVNQFLDEVYETGEDEYNYWLNKGWSHIHGFILARQEGLIVRTEQHEEAN